MKLSVVIPFFNEAANLESSLLELETYLTNYLGSDGWEVVAVNDGSSDNTLELLKGLGETKHWLKWVDLVINHGRGAAVRRGIERASGDILVTLDADLSYAPYHIERMVAALESQHADIVVASAYRSEGSVKNVPLNRLWLSQAGNKLLSYMYGENLTVLTCIVRAYRKEFIKKLDLHSDGKDIHLEILYKAKILGAKIHEIPADLAWKESKLKSKGKVKKRRSTLKIRKTSGSHLFFAMLNKPGFIYTVPACLLLAVSFIIFAISLVSIGGDMTQNGVDLYSATRNSMINATPSWLTLAVSFVLAIQFFSLGFLTNQHKKNYEETYKTLHSILKEIRNNN